MTVAINDLQKVVDKEVVLHLVKEDGSGDLEEVTGTIKAASPAGVAFKEKGKPGVDLVEPSRIEECALAPEKLKPVTKKKLKPVAAGQMRQHLADRHGIELEWCKNATEEQAEAFHNSIDHSKLGHDHTATDKKKDEAEAPAAESAA